MKKCNYCKEVLSLDKFSKKPGTYDGRNSRCKKCINTIRREKGKNKKLANINVKECNTCNLELPIDKFSINKVTSDGYQNRCKDCMSKVRKKNRLKKKKNKLSKSNKKTEKEVLLEYNLKKCNKCFEVFSLDKFNTSKNTKDGREGSCKTCRKLARKNKHTHRRKKTCTLCKKKLPVEKFYKDSSRYDGYDYTCKKCKSKKHVEYMSKEENRIKAKKRTAKWKKENPEKAKAYYRRNRKKIIKKTSEYHKYGKGKFALFKAQAKARGIENKFQQAEYLKMLEESCYYCGDSGKTGIDRLDSSKDYSLDNCVSCCFTCNYGKNTLLPEEFFSHVERIINFQKYKVYEDRKPKIEYTGNAKNDHYRSPFGKFTHYKSSAGKRKIPFKLEYKDFVKYWQKPCHYCGATIDMIGLDRMDNSLGYTVNNVVSCCTNCNNLKREQSKESFIEHCMKIFDNFN